MILVTHIPNVITKEDSLRQIIDGMHCSPHAILGMHHHLSGKKQDLVVRAFLRDCKKCDVVEYLASPEKRYPLKQVSEAGFFEALIPNRKDFFKYRLRIEKYNGDILHIHDPYAFLPSIEEGDLYLFNEGNNHRLYQCLGSNFKEMDGISGVSFCVWAPNAKRVSVVGDFNHWDGRYHPMRTMGCSGVWELFIPGLEEGTKYKYEIIGPHGQLILKTDPYAQYYEGPPNNASILWKNHFSWSDSSWIDYRQGINWKEKPISIYEVHFGSWRRVVEDGNRPLTYREMASLLPPYLNELGFTHVEFMPLAEHPFTGSWGYQVTGFFAPSHRYGTPEDFKFLIDTLHQHNIGVIIDWVPGHFPRDSFALAEFDGTYLYEHADPKKGTHQDWGTLIFNYGRHEVKDFLLASALSWLDRFHIDGLRVDAVASMIYLDYSRKEGEWIPNQYGGKENIEAIQFIREVNNLIHKYYPGVITIAEESTAFGGVTKPTQYGGLGFDFKWNMGWMHDNLRYFSKDPIHRKHHHNDLTFGMLYQYSEDFITVFSHDEVVHGKGSLIARMPSWSVDEKGKHLRALYTYMWMWPGKKTLFMGGEFGQTNEWSYDSSLDWHLLQYSNHKGTQLLVKDINNVYCNNPALGTFDHKSEGFEWVNVSDSDNSTISFLRRGPKPEDSFLVVGNFTPVTRNNYRVGVPFKGFWRELLNSNSYIDGGSGDGNMGGKQTENIQANGRPFSLDLSLPGLSTLIFQFQG